MELSLAHHPPSNTPNEELMIFDDNLRQEVVIAQRDKDTIFYEESDEIKDESELKSDIKSCTVTNFNESPLTLEVVDMEEEEVKK